MKRTPLARKSPLKRTAFKAKKAKPRKGAEPDRLAWIGQQHCAACNARPPNHAHHLIGDRKGLALKAPDSQTLSLCLRCHKDLHEKLGMFRVMTRDDLRSWQLAKIAHAQLLYCRFVALQLSKASATGELSGEPGDQFDSHEEGTVDG